MWSFTKHLSFAVSQLRELLSEFFLPMTVVINVIHSLYLTMHYLGGYVQIKMYPARHLIVIVL